MAVGEDSLEGVIHKVMTESLSGKQGGEGLQGDGDRRTKGQTQWVAANNSFCCTVLYSGHVEFISLL
jgi:hypothetical protein